MAGGGGPPNIPSLLLSLQLPLPSQEKIEFGLVAAEKAGLDSREYESLIRAATYVQIHWKRKKQKQNIRHTVNNEGLICPHRPRNTVAMARWQLSKCAAMQSSNLFRRKSCDSRPHLPTLHSPHLPTLHRTPSHMSLKHCGSAGVAPTLTPSSSAACLTKNLKRKGSLSEVRDLTVVCCSRKQDSLRRVDDCTRKADRAG